MLMVGQMLHEMHRKAISTKNILNEYAFFLVFNFEYVQKRMFSCGKLTYNVFIFCHFKAGLIFKGAKFHKRNQYLQS